MGNSIDVILSNTRRYVLTDYNRVQESPLLPHAEKKFVVFGRDNVTHVVQVLEAAKKQPPTHFYA